MKTITTRDLVHRTREIRESLEQGESFQWSQHGRIVAIVQSVRTPAVPGSMDWVSRARGAGIIGQRDQTVADLVAEDRGR